MEAANAWILSLQDEAVDVDKAFLDKMNGNDIALDVLHWMVALLKGATKSSSATRASVKNTLNKWIQCDKKASSV